MSRPSTATLACWGIHQQPLTHGIPFCRQSRNSTLKNGTMSWPILLSNFMYFRSVSRRHLEYLQIPGTDPSLGNAEPDIVLSGTTTLGFFMQFEPTDDIGRAIGRLTSRFWPVAVSPEVTRFAYRPLLRDSPKKNYTSCVWNVKLCVGVISWCQLVCPLNEWTRRRWNNKPL